MIFENVRIWYPKLDPDRPNAHFNADNPTWELQMRTTDKKQAQEWKEAGLLVKPLTQKVRDEEGNIVEDDLGEPQVEKVKEDGKQVYRAIVQKRSLKKDKTPNKPVTVIGGDLSEIDPRTIGNDSIANVRVFQYEGQTRTQSMLMAVQITTLNEFHPSGAEDEFSVTEFKVNKIADNQDEDDIEEEEEKPVAKKKAGRPPKKKDPEIDDDMDDEIPF